VSAYFFNAETGLRIDLVFDFPIPAATLAEHATRTKIRARVVDVASGISCVSKRSGSVGIRRVDDQLECTTVAQADRREVTYVARGQATDAESLGERDDRSIHKPKAKV
jgi:hypothetical protein